MQQWPAGGWCSLAVVSAAVWQSQWVTLDCVTHDSELSPATSSGLVWHDDEVTGDKRPWQWPVNTVTECPGIISEVTISDHEMILFQEGTGLGLWWWVGDERVVMGSIEDFLNQDQLWAEHFWSVFDLINVRTEGDRRSVASTLVETVSINYEDFSESFLTCSTCLCAYDGGELIDDY